MNHGSFDVRPLREHDELAACVALQREIWGGDFHDLAPPSLLRVVNEMGGLSAGAFDERGALLGFVFGFGGFRHGRPAHWSDMLAVRHDARGRGIGRALKSHQRRVVAAAGAERLYWTFEPLSARNAHLNFNLLGVTLDAMVEDFYGDTGSTLHAGLGTDRFIVAWSLDAEIEDDGPATPETARSPRVSARESATRVAFADAPAIDDAARPLPRRLRTAIPKDVFSLLRDDPAAGARWRERTRAIFRAALDAGLPLAGFWRGDDHGWYAFGEPS